MSTIKTYTLITFYLVFSFVGNAQDAIQKVLIQKLDSTPENPIHSISFYQNNGRGDVLAQVVGIRDVNLAKTRITDQFRIASSTKTFVATIILQMEEEERISITDNIYNYLGNIKFLRLDEFHLFEGNAEVGAKQSLGSKAITIKQLLSHRSGLADVFNDKQEAFFNRVMTNPAQQYTSKDIVNLYFEFDLHRASKFEPGEGWHYSDMNYVLLGLLIEKLDKKSLSQSIRDRIIEPLEMKDTYFEFYEKAHSKNGRLHQYVGSVDFNKINTSFDWSGGGLVSTHQDLAVFMKALFEEKLISKKSLEKMIAVQPTKPTELPYGLGVYQSIYDGVTYYGHYGFYGTYMGYCPEKKTVLSYCISQAIPLFNVYEFVNHVVKSAK